MMKLSSLRHGKDFSGKQFAWQGNEGVACSSDLGLPPGEWPNVIRVKSHRTGTVVGFVFNGFEPGTTAVYIATTRDLALKVLPT